MCICMSLSDLGFPDYLFICENPEPKDRVIRKPDRKLNDVLLQFGMVLSDGVMNYEVHPKSNETLSVSP